MQPFEMGEVAVVGDENGPVADRERRQMGIRRQVTYDASFDSMIEIPTPRWTAYDAKRFGVKMPPAVPMTTQERAYTSPIWYTPAK